MYVLPFLVGSGVLFTIIQVKPSGNEAVTAPDDDSINEADVPVTVCVIDTATLPLLVGYDPLTVTTDADIANGFD